MRQKKRSSERSSTRSGNAPDTTPRVRRLPQEDVPFLVDKPVGFSSFQIVRLLQKRYEKIGHAGTLDPFASGLLVMLPNRCTKQCERIQTMEKEYTGEIFLGLTTDTYDITGKGVSRPDRSWTHLDLEGCNRLARRFVGEVDQIPPRFSALKQSGRRLYELSRNQEPVRVAPRRVVIRSFDIEHVDLPLLYFRAVVGKGVYIRSLAHDLGEAAGCGACLLSLRRTRIGSFQVSDALTLADILDGGSC